MERLLNFAKTHLAAAGIFLAVFAIYFHPQIKGKVVAQRDIQQGKGMIKEVTDFHDRTGEHTLWTNAMFGGMPTYQISAPQESNLIRKYVEPTLQLFIAAPISWFFVAAMCFYILMIVVGVNRWVAIIGGLAFALSTNNMILFAEGHTSKFRALSYLPLALAGVYLVLQKREYLKGTALFLIAMSLNIAANHYQMTYYFAIAMMFFVVISVILILAQKTKAESETSHTNNIGAYLLGAVVLLISAVIAVGPSYSKIATTYEYTKYTMRGESDLKKERLAAEAALADTDVDAEGLNWDYAMMWSNSTIDLFASFIPGIAGGSSGELVTKDYPITQFFGNGKRDVRAPLYWGGADSTSGPVYFGAIVAFLLVLGIYLAPNSAWKYGILTATLIVMLLSMGRYFESFNKIFFNHFPKYDSFRAHNSAMGVVAVFFPIVALTGLSQFLFGGVDKKRKEKALIVSASVVGGIALIVALFGGAFSQVHFKDEFFLQQFQGNQQAYDNFMDALMESRTMYMKSSAFRTLIFVVLGGGTLWLFLKDKMKREYALLIIGGLIVFDMAGIDRKYLNEDEFISKKKQDKPFVKRPVDDQILNAEPNGRGYYRVLDLSINTFSSSNTSYFHNTVGGYSAVKMSRIQDVIDSMFRRGIAPPVLDMMNTKYIIDKNQQLYPNPTALGSAWFVDSFRYVSSATDELASLDNFNPATTAIVHTDFNEYMDGLQSHALDSSAQRTIALTSYEPNRLVYNSNTSTEEFAVFSEMWYGPNTGWDVYIDGKQEVVEHIRANYLLRAMKIPAGEHEIVFEFRPQTFEKGEKVSMASSIVILLLIVAAGGKIFLGGRKEAKA